MASIDKKRLGFTPDEGYDLYSRLCQNSGVDKKRRPVQTLIGDLSQLLSKGYILNKKTGEYERKVKIKSKEKKNIEYTLKAIKVIDKDATNGQNNEIYYTCDPEDNGSHMFIGFLTHANNPFSECMPCCFKKNKFETKNQEILEFYKQCSGEKKHNDLKQLPSSIGEILYILQDTNRIQEGRISLF